MSFYEKIEERVLKDQNIEVLKTISYEAKIKISKEDIKKVEEKLKQLGFQKSQERIEKDIVVSSQASNCLKLKEEYGSKKEFLLISNKKISDAAKLTYIIKFLSQDIYRWTFEKLLETLERETLLPKSIEEMLINLTKGDKNNIDTSQLREVRVAKIEKRRIVFYNYSKESCVSFDLDVIKKEKGQAIRLGDFIELSAKSKGELDFLLQQFKNFGLVTLLHYYEMENDFSKKIRS
jgi:adenylate cyclase class IV